MPNRNIHDRAESHHRARNRFSFILSDVSWPEIAETDPDVLTIQHLAQDPWFRTRVRMLGGGEKAESTARERGSRLLVRLTLFSVICKEPMRGPTEADSVGTEQ